MVRNDLRHRSLFRQQAGTETEQGDRIQEDTDGAEYQPEPLPECDKICGLATLSIERIPFDDLDGNTQGNAHERKVAILFRSGWPWQLCTVK